MFSEQFLAPFLTLFGEHDRFGLSHRIEDHSLLVQPIHRIPVVSFPCTSVVMDCQEEKCEHHLVNFVFVVFHKIMLPFRSQSFNHGCKVIYFNSGEFPEIRVEFPENWNFWLICGKSASYFCFRRVFIFGEYQDSGHFCSKKCPLS